MSWNENNSKTSRPCTKTLHILWWTSYCSMIGTRTKHILKNPYFSSIAMVWLWPFPLGCWNLVAIDCISFGSWEHLEQSSHQETFTLLQREGACYWRCLKKAMPLCVCSSPRVSTCSSPFQDVQCNVNASPRAATQPQTLSCPLS